MDFLVIEKQTGFDEMFLAYLDRQWVGMNNFNIHSSLHDNCNKKVTQQEDGSLENEYESKLALILEINMCNDFQIGTTTGLFETV